MWVMSAANSRVSTILLAFIVHGTNLYCAQAEARSIWLLQGTPSNDQPQTFPVRLYKIVDTKHLEEVREVVPSGIGLYSVAPAPTGDLVVSYPSIIPTTTDVVFAADPSKVSRQKFNPERRDVLNSSTALIQSATNAAAIVYPLITSPPEEPRRVAYREVEISDTSEKISAVKEVGSEAFHEIRYAGREGGPASKFSLMGRIDRGALWVDSGKVSGLARGSLLENASYDVAILGANEKVVVFCRADSLEVLAKASSRTVYILDRTTGSLREISQPGNISTTRLVGPWLITTVRMLWESPDDPRITDAPEYEGESEKTRKLYQAFERSISRTTGDIVMDNLVDGRRVRFPTKREDIEVLAAEGNDVYYRVNDRIFKGEVGSSVLTKVTLVVTSSEIPEVHWMILSPAAAN